MTSFTSASETREQKAAILRDNQNVVLITGGNRWEEDMGVVVEGWTTRATVRRTLEGLAKARSHQWAGSGKYELGPEGFRSDDGSEVLLAVRPDEVFDFAKGNFSRTRHMF